MGTFNLQFVLFIDFEQYKLEHAVLFISGLCELLKLSKYFLYLEKKSLNSDFIPLFYKDRDYLPICFFQRNFSDFLLQPFEMLINFKNPNFFPYLRNKVSFYFFQSPQKTLVRKMVTLHKTSPQRCLDCKYCEGRGVDDGSLGA